MLEPAYVRNALVGPFFETTVAPLGTNLCNDATPCDTALTLLSSSDRLCSVSVRLEHFRTGLSRHAHPVPRVAIPWQHRARAPIVPPGRSAPPKVYRLSPALLEATPPTLATPRVRPAQLAVSVPLSG